MCWRATVTLSDTARIGHLGGGAVLNSSLANRARKVGGGERDRSDPDDRSCGRGFGPATSTRAASRRPRGSVDPGTEVKGNVVTRDPGGLPVTGSDVIGLVVVGAAAVGVGSTAVVASRRRASRATA